MKKIRWICAIACAVTLCAGTAYAAVTNLDREAAIESKAAAESETSESKEAEDETAESTEAQSKSDQGGSQEHKADQGKAQSGSESKAAESGDSQEDMTSEDKAPETKPGRDEAKDGTKTQKPEKKLEDLFRSWGDKQDREKAKEDDRFPMTGREEGNRPDYGDADGDTDGKPDGKPEDDYAWEDDIYDMRTVTVSGSGSVRIVPDMAEFAFGITSTDKDASWAQKKNNEAVDTVVAKLIELGVEEKSITTTGYSIYPQYDYSSDTRELTGYEVRTTLTVKDQKIDAAGSIISECVEAGVNDFDYINFLCSDYEEAYQEALTAAVKAARKKAEIMAAAEDMKLGSVVTMTEGYQDTSASYTRTSGTTAMAVNDTADMSLMAGESEISAQVTVTYGMR